MVLGNLCSTGSGTTINNNANNRVITGSDSANTLEGESGLTFDGSSFKCNNTVQATTLTGTLGQQQHMQILQV